MEALTHGPVSVAIEADRPIFQFYHAGIVVDEPSTDPKKKGKVCGPQLDHGVLLVGYGHENYKGKDTGYWVVKNSWGEKWGDQGYIKLYRPLESDDSKGDDEGGECGILMQSSFPVFKGDSVDPDPEVFKTSAPNDGPYGAPPCSDGESAVHIQGMNGAFCAPPCDSQNNCPAPPSNTKAQPQCALQSPQGDHFCALLCHPQVKGECPANSNCEAVPGANGVGLCLFATTKLTTRSWLG
jgi:cathepsin L